MHTSPEAGPPAKLCTRLSVEASASQGSAGRGAGHTTSQKVQTPPCAAATRGAEDSLSCPIPTAFGSGMLRPLEGTWRPRPGTAGCFCCGGAWVLNTHFQGQTPPTSSLSMALRAAAHRSPGLSTRFCREMSLVHTCVFICSTGERACVFLSGIPSVLLPVSPSAGLNPPSWVRFSASSSTACQFQPTFCSSAPTVVTRTLLTHPCACEQHAA